MADNSTTPLSGLPVASDDISSIQYQRMKLIHGVDGTNDGDVANTNGFPVKSSYTLATLQNAVAATGNGTVLSVLGMASAVLTISGTFTATVTFEGTEDGSIWSSLTALLLGTGTMATSASAAGVWQVSCAGLQSVRARVTWTSGTSVTVTGHAVAAPWDSKPKNIAQIGGTAVDTNSGNKSAGTQRVVLATDQPALTTPMPVAGAGAAGAAISGNPVIAGGSDGTNARYLFTDTNGRQIIVGAAAAGAAIAGNPVQVGGSDGTNARALATDTAGNLTNVGSIAHDGVDSGNPIKVGMRAVAHGANPTGVAAADRTDWLASRAGVPFVMGGHPNIITKMLVITTAITDDSTISGTIATGAKVVVTQVQFTVDNASTVFPKIIIGFGATNTPASGAGVVAAHPGVPAGGGFTRGDGHGILGVGADGEELRVTTVGTIGGNGGYLTVSYYTIES